jgi:hypothetical protein
MCPGGRGLPGCAAAGVRRYSRRAPHLQRAFFLRLERVIQWCNEVEAKDGNVAVFAVASEIGPDFSPDIQRTSNHAGFSPWDMFSFASAWC